MTNIECDKKLQIRPRACAVAAGGDRTFFHVDLDAFFASVEQLKNPKLKGKPVIVGGGNSRRGVVAAASYEAKRFGVTTGMPWQQAKEKCPAAIFLPADFETYEVYSKKVRRILEKLAPVVAQASIDESYLDLTGCERLYGTSRKAAENIYREIKNQTGLPVSIGIAGSQSVAKMASKMAKPHGLVEVMHGSEKKFLAPMPVEAMPGIGSKIGGRLREMGILTLGQLASIPSHLLRASFGVYGPFLKAKALGKDTWELDVVEVIKSIGKQETFEQDVKDWQMIRQKLFQLVEMVGIKLREENLHAGRVSVFVRYGDFTPPPVRGQNADSVGSTGGGVTSEGTSKILSDPTHFDRVLFRYAEELLHPLVTGPSTSLRTNGKPIRLIGFSVENLNTQKTLQLDLFRTAKSERWERFYKSLDSLKKRLPAQYFRINI